jgi:sugar phosphate isomerase/epimerase
MPVQLLTEDLTRLGLAGHDFFDPPRQLLTCFTAELGIRNLDYWPWNRGELGIDAYRDLLGELGIEVYCVNLDTSRGRFGTERLEHAATEAALDAVDEAVAFGARYVQVYIERADGDSHAERIDNVTRPLARVARDAEAKGIVLAVENNFDHRNIDPQLVDFSRSPGALREIVELVGPDRLAITFDPVNFVMAGVDPINAYEQLGPFVVNVHLKDCVQIDERDDADDRKVLRDGDRRFARSVPVGQGDLAWPEFVAALTRAGFDGWFTVDPYCDPADVLDWTRQSLEYVRGTAAPATITSGEGGR